MGGTTFFGFLPEDEIIQGHNVLARWTRTLDDCSEWSFQTYYDASDRVNLALDQHVEVFDVDFQHRFPLGYRNNVIWGLRHRRVKDELLEMPPVFLRFLPPSSAKNLSSALIQDEVTLPEDLLYLTLGSKLEKKDFTGFEVQPSIRLLWLPSGHGYGAELTGTYQVTPCWKLTAWYTLLQLHLQNLASPPQSLDTDAGIVLGTAVLALAVVIAAAAWLQYVISMPILSLA